MRFRPIAPVSTSAASPSLGRWRILLAASLLVFTFATALAHAQEYTSIVVFGDSLSDTGNVAHLTQASYGVRIPGLIVDYADGRFTDGMYTSPAAQRFSGIWVEQFAAMLAAKPVVTDSLDGGTDYAYGDATTGAGTHVLAFGPTNAFPVTVSDVGTQIGQYLATKPTITDKTLFIVWAGANDLLQAKSAQDILTAAVNQCLNVQRLINAGATRIIVPNLPGLGLVPRINQSPAASFQATQASRIFNQFLASALAVVRLSNPGKHLSLYELDVYSLFNHLVYSPAQYGFSNVRDSSQGKPVIPDNYLFWDDLHPTTHGHDLLALATLKLLNPDRCRDSSPLGQECRSVLEPAAANR